MGVRENSLLQHIYRFNTAMPASVTLGPGDDMGGLRLSGWDVLVTVDQVIDGLHVDAATMPIKLVGRKAITRNLSDVAAMAAVPRGAVVAVALPRSWETSQATALFDAMRTTAEHYACPLFGGDISIWDGKLVLSVTVLAEPGPGGVIRRDTTQVGDAIYVTGSLGNSLASGHHLAFEPRLSLAQALASDAAIGLHAMMDLSDGLAMDLPRMVKHAVVEASALPVREGTPEPKWQHAIGDGEDYELLFTASGHVPSMMDGVPITRVGQVKDAGDNSGGGGDSGGVLLLMPDGTSRPMNGLGWEHGA
jgi:thiamine-monophosphate kinase